MRVRARDIMNRGHSRGHNRLHVHNSKLTSLERAPFLTHVLQRSAKLLAHFLCRSVDCLAGTRHIISVCKHAMATRTNIKFYRLNLPHSPSDSNAHSQLAARHSRPLQNHHSIGQLVVAPVLNCPFLSAHPSPQNEHFNACSRMTPPPYLHSVPEAHHVLLAPPP